VGIGYKNGKEMTNLDINTVVFTEDNYALYDMWSPKNTKPSLDTELSGTSDVIGLKYENNNNGSATLYFQRKLDTGDKYDKVIAVVCICFILGI
jgi:hypothetical protein